MTSQNLITCAEAAAILRTTVKTLAKWRCIGRYPALSSPVEKGGCVIKRGRAVFYREDLVRQFAAGSQTA